MQHIDVQHFLDLDLPFFEPKNIRRGGWSGVSRVVCAGQAYFVKRQVNHSYREPRRLFQRTPTLRREFRNILRLQSINIITPQVVLYAEQAQNAVLVTRELTGYVDLEKFLAETSDAATRESVLSNMTGILLNMHQNNFLHGCLYGKHIMVDSSQPSNIATIDLEKLRFSLGKQRNACKDISQLLRHTEGLTKNERDLIITTYEQHFSGITRFLYQRLNDKENRHIRVSAKPD